LPTGIFYANGVKVNVLFFDSKPASKDPWTKELKSIFLIENKIKAKPTDDQLLNQFNGARNKLIGLGIDQNEVLQSM
jgi:type I restriction-modification system DNA methylase subunit